MGHHHHHHHHGHSHSHAHDHASNRRMKNLGLALAINFTFSIIELVGGYLTGSVAIAADALHDFGDSLSLAMAMIFERQARTPSTNKYSYGYKRLSLFSALITGIVLVVGSGFVLWEAIPRLSAPVQPKTTGMLGLAVLGIAVNGFAAWRLSRGSSMNEKVLSWHLYEDLFGWVAVLIGSVVMMFVDLPIIDPILSIVFTSMILWNVMKNLRSTLGLFLQAAPHNIDTAKICGEITAIDSVVGVHDLHVWSLDGEHHVMTLHAQIAAGFSFPDVEKIKSKIKAVIASHGSIHATVEMETSGQHCPEDHCGAGV